MYRHRTTHPVRVYGLMVAAIAVVAAAGNSCVFETRTTFCEQFELRCKEGQECAASEPVCIAIGGCGNGRIDPGEVCDDGNTRSTQLVDGVEVPDSCSSDCQSTQLCGNGKMDIGEACDEGERNGDPSISCDIHCNLREKFCGNGTVDQVTEECDPGEMDSKGCNSKLAGDTLGCKYSVCGDGYKNVADGEQCDDSGQITVTCNGLLCTSPVCGDNFTNKPAGEQCDTGGDTTACNGDGNGDSNNVAQAKCHVPTCGDHYTNTSFTPPDAGLPEQCDTGDDSATCNGNNNGANGVGSCRTPRCGDTYVNTAFTPPGGTAPEECDVGRDTSGCNGNNGNANGPGSCRKPRCGDGYKNTSFTPPGADAPEQCDDAGDTQNCNGDNGTNDHVVCRVPRCGDGYTNTHFRPPGPLAAQEQCDDGGNSSRCNGSDNASGLGNCQPSTCGDGYRNSMDGEDCDKGDSMAGIPAVPCSPSSKTCTSSCRCI